MTLTEIANRINAHLKRMEADPKINTEVRAGYRRFWQPQCVRSDCYAFVTYILFQGKSAIAKSEAEKYLAWLEAGNIGRHFDMGRER